MHFNLTKEIFSVNTLARIKGVLVGTACGDAMGMPTEMLSRSDIADLFPNGITRFYPSTSRDIFHRTLLAGETTDDTANTLMVAHMLINSQGIVDTELYLKYLDRWITENSDKVALVIGPSTLRALSALKNGVSIEQSGIFGTTNGSAMKISPLGIVFDYKDSKGLAHQVEKICKPTHNTNIAISGANVVAACVSYGVRGGDNIEEMWNIAFQSIRDCEGKGFKLPTASLYRRLRLIHDLIQFETPEKVIDQLKSVFGTGIETIETIPTALAIVSISNGDIQRAASLSAEIGGDTDTIGAISGAICGALNPYLDSQLIEQLESVNAISFDAVAQELLSIMY